MHTIKRVSNTRELLPFAPIYVYRMRRVVGEHVVGYDVAIHETERKHHRKQAAWRLRDARAALRRALEQHWKGMAHALRNPLVQRRLEAV